MLYDYDNPLLCACFNFQNIHPLINVLHILFLSYNFFFYLLSLFFSSCTLCMGIFTIEQFYWFSKIAFLADLQITLPCAHHRWTNYKQVTDWRINMRIVLFRIKKQGFFPVSGFATIFITWPPDIALPSDWSLTYRDSGTSTDQYTSCGFYFNKGSRCPFGLHRGVLVLVYNYYFNKESWCPLDCIVAN